MDTRKANQMRFKATFVKVNLDFANETIKYKCKNGTLEEINNLFKVHGYDMNFSTIDNLLMYGVMEVLKPNSYDYAILEIKGDK